MIFKGLPDERRCTHRPIGKFCLIAGASSAGCGVVKGVAA
jgi:hypothetical protein